MKQDTDEQTSAVPGTAHGEDWSTARPDSDEYTSAVKVVRQPCGSFQKLFKNLVKPEVLLARAAQQELERAEQAKQDEAKQKEIAREAKRKRAQLRRKLRRLELSMDKLTKQETRLALFIMGKV
jgi:hypothetical protein